MTDFLPSHFRKLPMKEKRKILIQKSLLAKDADQILCSLCDLSELSDVLIESSLGVIPIPLGVATGFLINKETFAIPMATEEPSVIAAASYAARLVQTGGGFIATATDAIMTAQIYLQLVTDNALQLLKASESKIQTAVDNLLPKMTERGGGFAGFEIEEIARETLVVSIHINVCDSMGANKVNTVAEELKKCLEEISQGKALMCVLTNAAEKRLAQAEFRLPLKMLRKAPFSGQEVGKRIVEANALANAYPKRAVTHNKGIMNGITALALATGNDTRAIEAAAHFYAIKQGKYQALTTYQLQEDVLRGFLKVPIPLGTVGGSINYLPGAKIALNLLKNPGSKKLACIAASLGLAQNLAALFALVTEGIQKGHMKLHQQRERL